MWIAEACLQTCGKGTGYGLTHGQVASILEVGITFMFDGQGSCGALSVISGMKKLQCTRFLGLKWAIEEAC